MRETFQLILIILVIFSSCSKEESITKAVEFSKTYYHFDSTFYSCVKSIPNLGSQLLEGNAELNKENNEFGLAFINYSDTLNWRMNEHSFGINEIFRVSFSPLEIERYRVVNEIPGGFKPGFSEGSFIKYDSDSPLARYIIDPQKLSYFEFTSIDTVENFAEGNFNLHFIIAERYNEYAENFASQISFTQGSFKARISF